MHISTTHILFCLAGLAPIFGVAHANSTIHSPPNCEFAVTFPSAPTLQPITTQDGQTYEQAVFVGKGYFIRAECAPATAVPSRNLAMDSLRQFAANQGLHAAEFRHTKINVGDAVYGKGTKIIGGKFMTYEMQCAFGKTSFICLSGGAPVENSPNLSIAAFFKTISVAKRHPAERWTFFRKDDLGRDFFLGTGRLEREGDIIRVEVLQNLSAPKRTPMGDGKSIVQLLEFNCLSRQMRSTGTQLYEEQKAGGKLIAVSDRSSWQDSNASDLMVSMQKQVCSAP